MMNEITEKQALAIKNFGTGPSGGSSNGRHTVVETSELPIAKQVSTEQRLEEEKFLNRTEAAVEAKYRGVRGYLRLLQIMGVLGKLSLFLYLDQYDLHHKHHRRVAKERKERASRLTRLAYYGEYLYGIRMWFFHVFILTLRRWILGGVENKDAVQEKQAVWLRDKLIHLGPTFIK